jgi:hypothetical protein
MMKGEIGSRRISNHMVIIEAYIIDELNEQERERNQERMSTELPYPSYEMELDEAPADNNEQTVIIIDM